MSRIRDIAIAIVVSFETVAFLTVLAFYVRFPQPVEWVGTRLAGTDDRVRYLCFIPVGILALIVKSAKELLFPSDSDLRVLHEWPRYRMLRDRYTISILWAIVCASTGVVVWALKLPISDRRFVAVVLGATLIALIDYACLFNATLTVREVLGPKK